MPRRLKFRSDNQDLRPGEVVVAVEAEAEGVEAAVEAARTCPHRLCHLYRM